MRQTYSIIFVLLGLVTACTPQTIPDDIRPTQIISGNETAVSATHTPIFPTTAATAPPTAISATAVPTETAVSPTATAPPDPAVLAETLKQIMAATLQTETGSDAPFAGFEGLTAVPLPLAQEPPLWLVHSVGFRPFEPLQNHFVAVFAYENENFREIGRAALENPDILFDNSVQSWEIDGRLWLEVNSGVGAHGNCLDVLRLDQTGLFDDIAYCHSTMAGSLTDLNQDGLPEIVLNNTNDYVFCYACAVQLPDYAVLTWNGTGWQPVSLVKLGGSTDMILQNNEAVALAEAG
ncbi:MAG: hypothetical protein KC419_13905, partial [Anaerolineales bacterium]|nr:hypothetical protein [Anaerolineales bacterium]